MCSSVFTERNPGHLAECWRPEREKIVSNVRHFPMRGAVAHAGWALRRPVGPTAASFVPSPPTPPDSVRVDVRYVYSVIEPHGVRYKQGMGRREFGARPDPSPRGG